MAVLTAGFKEAFTAYLASRLPVQLPGHETTVQGSSLLSQAGGAVTPLNGGTGANTPIPGGGGQTGMHPPGAIIRVLKWDLEGWVDRRKLRSWEVR